MAGEPEWLPEDIEAALEWQDYQSSLCSGCGNPKAECFDPKNEDDYEAEPLRCHACATRDRKAKLVGSDEHADASGLYFAVTRDNEKGE